MYFAYIASLTLIYAIAAVSFWVLFRYLRVVSINHAFLMGVGAYAGALCAIHMTPIFPIPFVFAAFAGLLAGLLIERLARDLRGDTFVLMSLGVQVTGEELFRNVDPVTNGALGLSGIPRSIFGIGIAELGMLCGLIVLFFLIQLALQYFLSGRVRVAMLATGEDARLAASRGTPVKFVSQSAFAISGLIAGLSGAALAQLVGFIDPSSFTIAEAIIPIAIVIIAASDRSWLLLATSAGIIATPEVFRLIGGSVSDAAVFRSIAFSIVLISLLARRRYLFQRYSQNALD